MASIHKSLDVPLKRTRSCSCFVTVKWQQTLYKDVQVVLQDTPAQLKSQLERMTSVPVASQQLLCRGRVLRDDTPLYALLRILSPVFKRVESCHALVGLLLESRMARRLTS
jgi:hypothetical protein